MYVANHIIKQLRINVCSYIATLIRDLSVQGNVYSGKLSHGRLFGVGMVTIRGYKMPA